MLTQAQAILLRYATEKEFQQWVIETAKEHGWLYYHTYRSEMCAPGFPDNVFCEPDGGGLFFAELKIGKKQPSQAQRRWLAALERNGIECHVWYPHDQDRIVKRFAGLSI